MKRLEIWIDRAALTARADYDLFHLYQFGLSLHARAWPEFELSFELSDICAKAFDSLSGSEIPFLPGSIHLPHVLCRRSLFFPETL